MPYLFLGFLSTCDNVNDEDINVIITNDRTKALRVTRERCASINAECGRNKYTDLVVRIPDSSIKGLIFNYGCPVVFLKPKTLCFSDIFGKKDSHLNLIPKSLMKGGVK